MAEQVASESSEFCRVVSTILLVGCSLGIKAIRVESLTAALPVKLMGRFSERHVHESVEATGAYGTTPDRQIRDIRQVGGLEVL